MWAARHFWNSGKTMKLIYTGAGVSGGFSLFYQMEYLWNNNDHANKHLKLVWPTYTEGDQKGKVIKVVSPRQVEYLAKAGNQFRKTIGVADDTCDIVADYSEFTVINSIKPKENSCNVEPGITLDKLNKEVLKGHNQYVPWVLHDIQDKEDRKIDVDTAIQENRLCVESFRHQRFKDSVLERASYFTGAGQPLVTGGYKLNDHHSFGYNMKEIMAGSKWQLGLLCEAVLRTIPNSQQGYLTRYRIEDSADVLQFAKNFQEHESEFERRISGLIIRSPHFNNGHRDFFIFGFDQPDRIEANKAEIKNELLKDLHHLEERENRSGLDPNSDELVQKLRVPSQYRVTDQVDMVVPIDSSMKFLYKTRDYLIESEHFPYQIHMLPDCMLVRLYFNAKDEQKRIDQVDMMTSKAIKLGGVVDSNKRSTLDTINPYLVERMVGTQGLEIQRALKASFDPNNLLSPDYCIDTTEAKRIATNPFLWLKWRNKHIYYFTTM